MSQPMTILITGASSGFGLRTARTLIDKGHRVFATMRQVDGRNAAAARELGELARRARGSVQVLEMDVTDDASVERTVRDAVATAGGLDVVVNNAGIGVGGHAEAFTVDQYRGLFDVNVLGVQRVNRAVLPSMREAGSGLLVHVSSVMGRVVIPFAAPYTASKWALEGMVESYRYELAPTGVEVVIVEPGGFMTGMAERIVTPADGRCVETYGALAGAPDKMWKGMMEALRGPRAPDPQEVADTIARLIDMPPGKRPFRTVVDPLTGGDGPAALNGASEKIQRQLLDSLDLGELLSSRARD